MKKAFLFLLATSALLSSCGSDDNGGSKRASAVTIQGGSESLVYGMTYDSKGRLSTMSSNNSSGAHNYAFSYNDQGKMVSAVATGSVTGTSSFTYDAQGRLATVTRPGQATMNVVWSDATTAMVDGSYVIKLDSKGDLLILDTLNFTRDTGNGAFKNVKVDPLPLALVELQTVFFASKKPAKTITAAGEGYFLTNTLQDGYVSSATFAISGSPYTMNIAY